MNGLIPEGFFKDRTKEDEEREQEKRRKALAASAFTGERRPKLPPDSDRDGEKETL